MDGETWKKWVERFWFLRGIAAALTVVQLVPVIFDLSRFEFLRAFYALLVGWTDFMSWIGSWIGQLPFLPELDGQIFNAALFTLAVGVPGSIALLEIPARAPEGTRLPHRLRWEVWEIVAKVGAVALIFISPIIYLAAIKPELLSVLSPENAQRWTERELMAQCAALVTFGFGVALVKLNGYARGLVTVITFVMTLQLLYWLNTPWLADQINALADSALGQETGSGPTTQ